MDPASIIGLSAAIQQLLGCIFKYGQGVREAKSEINQLCSELLALRAALEHVQLILQPSHSASTDVLGDAQALLSSSIFASPEFLEMLSFTNDVLKQLLARIETKPKSLNSSLQRLTWPLIKSDVNLYVQRLERSKQWFILATTSDNLTICKESYLKICSIDRRLQLQQILDVERQDVLFRDAVKTWLAPYDPYPIYETSLAAYQKGTGSWLLDGALRDWLNGRIQPILWLKARPGVGKTTMLSAAINSLKNSDASARTSFFFCSFTDQETHDPKNLLGSLVVQMCDNNNRLWKGIDERYRKVKEQSLQRETKQLDMHELTDLVVQCCEHLSGAFVILDALNESKQSLEILQILVRMSQESKSLRILISSTEEFGMDQTHLPATTVTMDKEGTASDILDYIDKRLQHDDRFSSLPKALKDDIKSVLRDRSDGIFRWVQCQLETLTEQETSREIRNALLNVPRTLETTYRNILARITGNDVEKARRALFWISFSLRPLKFAELCEAIIIPESCSLHSPCVISEDMRLLRPAALLRICSSLISYDPTTTRVTLAHSSVMQYLTSRVIEDSDVSEFFLDEEAAETDIEVRCLNYLCLPAFANGYCPSRKALAKRFKEWPLLPYIAQTLFIHLSYTTLKDPFQTLLIRFFETQTQPRGGNFGAWVQAFNPATHVNLESSTPLYYAARFGLLSIVRVILEREGTRNLERAGGAFGCTPLHVAAWAGQKEIVKELLDAGANPREVNERGESGLIWALKLGHNDIVQMLRKAGARLEPWMDLECLDSDSDQDEAARTKHIKSKYGICVEER